MSKQEKLDSMNVEKQQKESVVSDGKINQSIATIEANPAEVAKPLAKEINGPKGLEPTRYGDWESKGRCYDF
ncbi:MAG: hypothetical protein ACJA2E_002205 [Arenicella sp.]|jgi:hypothetical protein